MKLGAQLLRNRSIDTDGPIVETKDLVAGFEVIDSVDLPEAIESEIAAAHPVACFHAIEVRPFTPGMCGEPAGEFTTELATMRPYRGATAPAIFAATSTTNP